MEYLAFSANDIPIAEGELPDRVRWGFCSLEEWSRDAVRQIAVHAQEVEELRGELEDDRPLCWEVGCGDDPVVCQRHHDMVVAAKEAD